MRCRQILKDDTRRTGGGGRPPARERERGAVAEGRKGGAYIGRRWRLITKDGRTAVS